MESLIEILHQAVAVGASDILLIAGASVSVRRGGAVAERLGEALTPNQTDEYVGELYTLAERDQERFRRTGDDDFPLSVRGLSRFRVSAYRQRGTAAAVVRVVRFEIPTPEAMSIPPEVMDIAGKRHGLVLVTGPTGCGKSTTQACLVDAINATRDGHIITIEDPIEYLHRNKRSAVSQREIGSDTQDYLTALRAALRQTPDVVQLGEMRDYDTITATVTAAETGLLILSTLHTLGAANTIDRVIDVFPPKQQNQIRLQLSMTLQAVVSQQLLPSVEGGLVPAFEVMHINSAIRNLIREAKTHQIDAAIQTGSAEGMVSMDAYILRLYRAGRITAETAVKFAANAAQLSQKIGR